MTHTRDGPIARSVHLIVLIHGLYGNPGNLAVVKEELERAAASATSAIGDSVEDGQDEDEVETQLLLPSSRSGSVPARILVLKSFQGSHTWDGIDVNAHRAAREVSPLLMDASWSASWQCS